MWLPNPVYYEIPIFEFPVDRVSGWFEPAGVFRPEKALERSAAAHESGSGGFCRKGCTL